MLELGGRAVNSFKTSKADCVTTATVRCRNRTNLHYMWKMSAAWPRVQDRVEFQKSWETQQER